VAERVKSHQRQMEELQKQQEHLKTIAAASEMIANIQADLHGYTALRRLKNKIGRIIFGMGLFVGWLAYWNPSGSERGVISRMCSSSAGKMSIAVTVMLYLMLSLVQ